MNSPHVKHEPQLKIPQTGGSDFKVSGHMTHVLLSNLRSQSHVITVKLPRGTVGFCDMFILHRRGALRRSGRRSEPTTPPHPLTRRGSTALRRGCCPRIDLRRRGARGSDNLVKVNETRRDVLDTVLDIYFKYIYIYYPEHCSNA